MCNTSALSCSIIYIYIYIYIYIIHNLSLGFKSDSETTAQLDRKRKKRENSFRVSPSFPPSPPSPPWANRDMRIRPLGIDYDFAAAAAFSGGLPCPALLGGSGRLPHRRSADFAAACDDPFSPAAAAGDGDGRRLQEILAEAGRYLRWPLTPFPRRDASGGGRLAGIVAAAPGAGDGGCWDGGCWDGGCWDGAERDRWDRPQIRPLPARFLRRDPDLPPRREAIGGALERCSGPPPICPLARILSLGKGRARPRPQRRRRPRRRDHTTPRPRPPHRGEDRSAPWDAAATATVPARWPPANATFASLVPPGTDPACSPTWIWPEPADRGGRGLRAPGRIDGAVRLRRQEEGGPDLPGDHRPLLLDPDLPPSRDGRSAGLRTREEGRQGRHRLPDGPAPPAAWAMANPPCLPLPLPLSLRLSLSLSSRLHRSLHQAGPPPAAPNGPHPPAGARGRRPRPLPRPRTGAIGLTLALDDELSSSEATLAPPVSSPLLSQALPSGQGRGNGGVARDPGAGPPPELPTAFFLRPDPPPPGDGLPADGLSADGLPADGIPADGLPADGLPAKACSGAAVRDLALPALVADLAASAPSRIARRGGRPVPPPWTELPPQPALEGIVQAARLVAARSVGQMVAGSVSGLPIPQRPFPGPGTDAPPKDHVEAVALRDSATELAAVEAVRRFVSGIDGGALAAGIALVAAGGGYEAHSWWTDQDDESNGKDEIPDPQEICQRFRRRAKARAREELARDTIVTGSRMKRDSRGRCVYIGLISDQILPPKAYEARYLAMLRRNRGQQKMDLREHPAALEIIPVGLVPEHLSPLIVPQSPCFGPEAIVRIFLGSMVRRMTKASLSSCASTRAYLEGDTLLRTNRHPRLASQRKKRTKDRRKKQSHRDASKAVPRRRKRKTTKSSDTEEFSLRTFAIKQQSALSMFQPSPLCSQQSSILFAIESMEQFGHHAVMVHEEIANLLNKSLEAVREEETYWKEMAIIGVQRRAETASPGAFVSTPSDGLESPSPLLGTVANELKRGGEDNGIEAQEVDLYKNQTSSGELNRIAKKLGFDSKRKRKKRKKEKMKKRKRDEENVRPRSKTKAEEEDGAEEINSVKDTNTEKEHFKDSNVSDIIESSLVQFGKRSSRHLPPEPAPTPLRPVSNPFQDTSQQGTFSADSKMHARSSPGKISAFPQVHSGGWIPICVLCSEHFFENFSEVVADLSTGKWFQPLINDKNDRNEHELAGPGWGELHTLPAQGQESFVEPKIISLFDSPLIDEVGVDIELPGRVGVVASRLSSWSVRNSNSSSDGGGVSDESVKSFIRRMVYVAATGRYNTLHILLVVDGIVDLTSPLLSNGIVLLQNALIRQPASPCEHVTIQYVSPKSISTTIAHIVVSEHTLRYQEENLVSAALSSVVSKDWIEDIVGDEGIREKARFLLAVCSSLSVLDTVDVLQGKNKHRPFREIISSLASGCSSNARQLNTMMEASLRS